MKRFLLALACLAFGFEAYAANPSFSSFATNHFITNNFLIRSRLNPFQFDTNASNVTITNLGSLAGTNTFNTIVVSNLYTTNLFYSTNIVTYITNLYVTNIVVDNITVITNITIGGTNAATMADLVWTNEIGNIRPTGLQNQVTATNIVSWERLTSFGSLILATVGGQNLVAGLNDVSAYTNSVLWVTGFDSDPANSSVRLDGGNGQGQLLVVQNYADNSGFTMRNGESLFASPPGAVQILKGDWVTSTKGDSLLLYNNGLNWTELGRMPGSTNNTGSSFWENVAGVLRPLGFSAGTNQFTIAESTSWSGTGTNAFMDDGTFQGVAQINPTDGAIPYRVNAYEFGDLAAGTGFLHNDGANTYSWQSVSSEWTNNAGILQPVNFTLQPMIEKGLVVGTNTPPPFNNASGGESLLSVRDTDVGDPNWNQIHIETRANGGADYGQFDVSSETNHALMIFSAVQGTDTSYIQVDVTPTSGEMSLGKITEYIIGFESGTNYSRAALYHSGTNGAVVVDSQSRGTAGNPVPFMFAQNGTIAGWISQTNVALGYNALKKATNISQNVAIGPSAFGSLTNGGQNVAVGNQAGLSLVNNTDNTLVGFNAGFLLTSDGNTLVGSGASAALRTGRYNTALGSQAAYYNVAGNYSTMIGMQAGAKATNLLESTIVGAQPLNGFESFTNTLIKSTWVGYKDSTITNWNGAYTNVILIGHNLMPTNSNEIVIGNTNNTRTYLPPAIVLRGITKVEKTALTPVEGMVVYQTDTTPGLRVYQSGAWVMVSTVADP